MTNEYRFSSTSMFYVPNMVRWVENMTARDIEASARDEAARLWMLGQMFPNATVETLLQIMQGEYTVEGEDVVVKGKVNPAISRQDLDDGGPI
jgi:hypothetical protein